MIYINITFTLELYQVPQVLAKIKKLLLLYIKALSSIFSTETQAPSNAKQLRECSSNVISEL